MKGGYGAPAAVDTLETIIALGVKYIVVVGLCGIFKNSLSVGAIILPQSILSEEGTSRHYYETIDFVSPDSQLLNQADAFLSQSCTIHQHFIVSSDSVYRQTFKKETYWRELGCVGVDMEASAILAVSQYYGIKTVAMFMASDKHPQSEKEQVWEWGNLDFDALMDTYSVQAVKFALN